MPEAIHIGKAATLTGVSVDTIRFYQKLGLIKCANRSAGGYRLFDGEQTRELKFVRPAQELGFSLSEVKELLALRQTHHACSDVQSMLKGQAGGCAGENQESWAAGSGACRGAPQLQPRAALKTGNPA